MNARRLVCRERSMLKDDGGSIHQLAPVMTGSPAAASDVTPRMSLVLQSFLPYPDSCLGTSPHQQGWDTKMAELSFGGIDVSKDRLDVLLLPEGLCFSVCNDAPGWAELIVRLRRLAVSAIGLEPSGGYERGIIRALFAAGLSVRRINPNKLRPNWIARLARSPYSMTLVAAGASGFLTSSCAASARIDTADRRACCRASSARF